MNIEAILVLVAISALAIALFFLIEMGIKITYADDTESDLGFCLRGYDWYCNKVDVDQLYDQLLERAQEFNKLNNNNSNITEDENAYSHLGEKR